MAEATIISGKVTFRSSSRSCGPPGEREIAKLNPQRIAAILRLTGWAGLKPGRLTSTAIRAKSIRP